MFKTFVPISLLAIVSCCCAGRLPLESPSPAPSAEPVEAHTPEVERAATLAECVDFIDRWQTSEIDPRPIPRPVPDNPYDPRGVVIGHRFPISIEPAFPPQLVDRVTAIAHIERWCSFAVMTEPPTRAYRGACFVDEMDRCWFALRRRGDDFFVAGYFGAMNSEPEAQDELGKWLDAVDAVYGAVK